MLRYIKKAYLIFLLVCFNMIILTGCFGLDGIDKNKIMIDYIEKEESIVSDEDMALTESEAIKIAQKGLNDFFNIEFNPEDFNFEMDYITPEMNEKKFAYMGVGKYLGIKLDYADSLEQGYYTLYWQSNYEVKTIYGYLRVDIDAKTKEVILVEPYKIQKDIYEFKGRSNEDSKLIAERYVRELNQNKGTNYVIEEEFIKKYNNIVTKFYYLYKVEDDESQKMLVSVDSLHDNVNLISFGLKAFLDYYEVKNQL